MTFVQKSRVFTDNFSPFENMGLMPAVCACYTPHKPYATDASVRRGSDFVLWNALRVLMRGGTRTP
ncbi:hypothetical protein BD309DRAFT_211830 [Dichomitus squalens]|nr:hypothetical protein BD309DRAFT_211830 [Dichomitus squalens]